MEEKKVDDKKSDEKEINKGLIPNNAKKVKGGSVLRVTHDTSVTNVTDKRT